MRWANLTLRFLLELAALASFGAAEWNAADGVLRVIAAVVAVALAGAYWGVLVAPKSRRRLRDPGRMFAELVFFALAGAALASVTSTPAGLVFTAVAWVNAGLVRALGESTV